jgi:hypothetical protein
MARGVYAIQFNNVSVTAAQDLLCAYAGATRKLLIHGVVIGQITQTTIGNLRIRGVRLPATVTTGSAGTSVTPAKTDPTDAAATFTARANDTTQATTSGTAVAQFADVWNPINGYQMFWPPADRPKVDLSEAFSLSLDQAPAAGITTNATLWVEEL